MICVFDIIEGPARGKRFWLRANQRMAVGRISTADFAVPADVHMSRHHLILEVNCEVVRLRDVGSANGTYVNESRINSLELHAGDKIRAGSTIIELSVLPDHEDPHSKDGLSIATVSGRTSATQQTDQSQVNQPASGTIQSASIMQTDPLGNPPLAQQTSSPPLTVGTRVVRVESVVNAIKPNATKPAVSEFSSSKIPMPELSNAQDNDPTLRLNLQWWMGYFQPSESSNFYQARPLIGASPNLLDALRSAPTNKPMAFVVNQSQLGRPALESLRQSIDHRLITPLSHALMLVRFDGSDALWEFVGQSLKHDAVTCLCARKTFELSWLNDLLDQLSYPSMLASLLKSDNRSLKVRLSKHVHFGIFECNRAGDLGMYLNDDCLKSS